MALLAAAYGVPVQWANQDRTNVPWWSRNRASRSLRSGAACCLVLTLAPPSVPHLVPHRQLPGPSQTAAWSLTDSWLRQQLR